MRLAWSAVLLAALTLTVDCGRSSGGSRTSGSGSRSYGGSHSTGSSRPSSHSSGGISSGRISKPHSSNTHSTSHVLPLTTGSRTSRPPTYNRNTPRPITHHKPTTRPQIYTRNTPRPIVHPKPATRHNTTSSGGTFHHTSTTGRHNSTSGSGGFHHSSSTGRHNTTSSGGSFHHTSTTGRHNSTSGSGGFHHGSSTGRHNTSSSGSGFNHGRHNTTSGVGGFHNISPSGRHNSTSGGFHHGSTGGKVNDNVQQAHVTNQHSSAGVNPHAPSAPLQPSGSNLYAPSAPPLPGPGGHQPPGPGWHPGVTNDAQKQHINNLNNQYPGVPPPYPSAPGHYPAQAPPPYPGGIGHYPTQAPPSYPGGVGHYPVQAPPTYPGTNQHYPNQPIYYPGSNQHYPVQPGGPVYQQPYYPPPPPPPPGYSPYGAPYYKDKSGIRGSDVVAGLALWELMRSRNHHHHGYGIQQVHHHHYQDGSGGYDSPTYYQPTYHDAMRERYTTRTTPSRQTGPGAYNILEMTHYITADDKGVISSSEGNMTCISVYNAKSISGWHQRQVNDFKKQYPDSIYPLYRTENDTQSENFTVVPGRIIHKEPVSITCCGTNKGPIDLNLLTNGKHPNVNCVNHLGHIPIKKLTFIRTQAQIVSGVNTTAWHEIQLRDPNATTPVPLAPFPTNFSPNSSTPTPLAPFPPNVLYSSIQSLLPHLAPIPTNVTTSTASSIDFNQTFVSIGVKNDTGTVDMTQVFDSLGSNTIGVTNNPSDLIVG